MNAPYHFLDTIENLSTYPRIIGSIAIAAVVLFGTAQWMPSGANTTLVDAVLAPGSAAPETAAFEYFPAAYVNQATQREEHIEAF